MDKKNLFAFGLVSSLFFFWGFIHNLDPVLIPHLRNAFSLSHLQASLVDSSVFIAYFIMAIPAGVWMQKYGYKSGILIGLLFFAAGCFLFIPAANSINYFFFLGALFVVACGLAILETAANPYVSILGTPATAARRLNFAQAFNGLAASLAPLVGSKMILTQTPKSTESILHMSASSKQAFILAETATVKMPYVILGSLILLVAVVFYFTRLPDVRQDSGPSTFSFFHVLTYRHVRMSILAQFFYVGAQICIFSFLILYATEIVQVPVSIVGNYAMAAGLAFLIGRFVGVYFLRFISASVLLAVFSALAVVSTLFVILGNGIFTLYAMVAIAFFMSIMYPTIFALGIRGLGEETKAASSMIVMSIVGGAVLPPVLGYISDKTGNFRLGYIVPLLAFVLILFFALANRKVIISGGINKQKEV